jgi:hypothetical protein
MKRYSILAVALAITLHSEATAQPSTTTVDLITALARLRAAVSALPSPLQSPRLRSATQWLVDRPNVSTFNPADVSAEYARSLERAAELLKEQPTADVIEDVTAELEAKVEHCRKLGIGMGGLVTLKVNTLRGGKAVSNWRVQALLKFYERLAGTQPRVFFRPSSPTEMELEPGRYWVWAVDPGTGRMSERVLVPVTGQKELLFDLDIP